MDLPFAVSCRRFLFFFIVTPRMLSPYYHSGKGEGLIAERDGDGGCMWKRR